MEIKAAELIEIIKELIEFADKKLENNETTTKGAKNLKYKIYGHAERNKYKYKDFFLKGYIGQGNLKVSDVGIAFLYEDNKISYGFYICFVYNYREKKIRLELGSSKEKISKLPKNKEDEFNNEHLQEFYRRDLDYSKLIIEIDKMLKNFLEFHKILILELSNKK